jgi:MoaA/NifB/PqqE/SkfB family radical SAM enzyme
MIKTTAINLKNPEPMMVTWDLGRRCNYDCTYCEASRHNNYSPHSSLDTLKNTFNFIKEWTAVYNTRRKFKSHTNVDFTGGEPTVNPNFWNLVKYIKEENTGFNVGLTTNGTWPEKDIDKISKYIDGITISWHAEADPILKKRVLNNVLLVKEHNIWLQVNVMMHCDYFDEAKEVCAFLKEHGVKYNTVPIGDGTKAQAGWFKDSDGIMRRTSHEYTEEQQEWFWNEVGITDKAKRPTEGTEVGRKCCGGRCLEGLVDGDWKPVTLVENKFKGWHCMIDWFFMHIDQETGNVYHHQTCQARKDGTIGPIGNLSNTKDMINSIDLDTHMICPNQRCGCGMCIPKAKSASEWERIFAEHV